MKVKFLYEAIKPDGAGLASMWSNPTTIYYNKNGSAYIIYDGKRETVHWRNDRWEMRWTWDGNKVISKN